MTDYPMVILPLTDEDGGGYTAFFPDLPGCLSDGETPQEAVENALDAFNCWMEVQVERKVEIPEPHSSQSAIVDMEDEIEAMAKTIAKLTSDLDAANARIAELEGRTGNWLVKGKHSRVARHRNVQFVIRPAVA